MKANQPQKRRVPRSKGTDCYGNEISFSCTYVPLPKRHPAQIDKLRRDGDLQPLREAEDQAAKAVRRSNHRTRNYPPMRLVQH